MSDLIVRSWADLEVLQWALSSGIPSLILVAVYGSALHQEMSFMTNQRFGTRLADSHLVIDPKNHGYGAGWIGFTSGLWAGWFSSAQVFVISHATKIIDWETARARRGLTVGYFPHLRFFRYPDGHGRVVV